MNNEHTQNPQERPLESWKEIAAYLKRDPRTVARWEKNLGLPIRRLRHGSRSTIYAYPSELDAWRQGRTEETEERQSLWRRPMSWVAAVLALITAGVVFHGPILNVPGAHVEAAKNGGTTVHKMWSGDWDVLEGDTNGRISVYTDYWMGRLMVLNLETGETKEHPDSTGWSNGICRAFRLSPSGKHAACSWWRPGTGTFDLRVLSLDGGKTTTLVAHTDGQEIWPYDWSQDGKRLLVTVVQPDATIQIGVVSFPEGEPRVVKSLEWRRPRNLSFSPDGRYIAYDVPLEPHSNNRDIFSLAVDGSSETPLVEHPAADYSPYWTPDGSGVLFLSGRNDEQSVWLQPVEKGRPVGSPRLLRKDADHISPLGFDESGSFYWGQYTLESGLYLAEVDFDKGRFVTEPRRLRLRLGQSINDIPRWSPDGKFLSYPLALGPRQADEAAFVIREVETETERVVYTNLNYLPTRYWFPKGDALLAESRDARGRPGVFRVDVKTGEEVAIYRNSKGSQVHQFCRKPQLTPDERFLFCQDKHADGEARLYRHDLDSGKDLELYRWRESEIPSFHHLSPDGRWLAIKRSDRENSANSQLLRVPSEGGEPQVLHSGPDVQGMYIFAWTPDSRWILLSQRSKEQGDVLYQVSVDGSIARALQPFSAPKHAWLGGRGFDIHPNGRTVAMKIGGGGGSEIWAMENFGGQEAPPE